MLIVWPELYWLDDRIVILAFLAVGTVITALVFRVVLNKVRRHNDHDHIDD